MYAQVRFPENLRPEELDDYLSHGWFRMGQTIFTTNFLHFKNEFYSAVWLRVRLNNPQEDSAFTKMRKRNAAFTIEINQASITLEKEELFAQYKEGIVFEASASLQHLLFGKVDYSIYNTYEILIRDGGKLIAAGFFDIGRSCSAGITCFYNPAYKKYSLGKYLIYLKMEYCKKLGHEYFYPGYFAPGYSFFNYKLDFSRPTLEYYQLNPGAWMPIENFNSAVSPLQIMRDKLADLKQQLEQKYITTYLLKYEFFDVNLVPDLKDAELFDYPIFLCFNRPDITSNPIVIYDVHDQRFKLVACVSIFMTNQPDSSEDIYSSHILKVDRELLHSAEASGIANGISLVQ